MYMYICADIYISPLQAPPTRNIIAQAYRTTMLCWLRSCHKDNNSSKINYAFRKTLKREKQSKTIVPSTNSELTVINFRDNALRITIQCSSNFQTKVWMYEVQWIPWHYEISALQLNYFIINISCPHSAVLYTTKSLQSRPHSKHTE